MATPNVIRQPVGDTTHSQPLRRSQAAAARGH